MAIQARPTGHHLTHKLLKEAKTFSFFQAVQLLERYVPDAAPVGHQGPARKECLRFRPEASLAFPTSDISEIEAPSTETGGEDRYKITVTFMGLYGSSSPLPTYYTEDILSMEGYDTNVRDFLDLFHHRLISLFYRTWTKYRYYVQYRKGGIDPLSERLLSLIGLDEFSVQKPRAVPPVRFLRYAGAYTLHPRSQSTLQGILSDFFGEIPVGVKPCMKRQVPIPEDQRNRLGQENCILGQNCTVGSSVEDRSGKFRLCIGPVEYERFIDFLPGGKNHKALEEILDQFLIDSCDYDTEIQVLTEGMPSLSLSSTAPSGLGWNSWLLPPTEKHDSVILQRTT